jgi:hypothetical protein
MITNDSDILLIPFIIQLTTHLNNPIWHDRLLASLKSSDRYFFIQLLNPVLEPGPSYGKAFGGSK